MPRTKSLTSLIFEKLKAGGWPKITYNVRKKLIQCPKGKLLSYSSKCYTLTFYSYSQSSKDFHERNRYSQIIFPSDFNILKFLYFKTNGNFKLTSETQFRKIINPEKKNINKIKISSKSKARRFYKDTLTLSKGLFEDVIKEAQIVYKKQKSYATSAENYWASIASQQFTKFSKQRVTYLNKGEFSFLIDRLNLNTKRNRKDFQKYLDKKDIHALEDLLDGLIKNDLFSEDFLRRLDEYFIKEKLKEIINWGREILDLKSSNLSTIAVKKILQKLSIDQISQLENLWQKYFEKYLLYLIFSYKKIFPKVELRDIDGDKKYPDFIGVNHYNGLDVIEIKTHLTKILTWDNSHKNFYFSPEMSKSIVQTTNYLDAIMRERFKDKRDRNKITNFVEEENLYHPRGIIIISSDKNLTKKNSEKEKLSRDFTKLRNSVHNIEILTFNEILNIANEYIQNIASS